MVSQSKESFENVEIHLDHHNTSAGNLDFRSSKYWPEKLHSKSNYAIGVRVCGLSFEYLRRIFDN